MSSRVNIGMPLAVGWTIWPRATRDTSSWMLRTGWPAADFPARGRARREDGVVQRGRERRRHLRHLSVGEVLERDRGPGGQRVGAGHGQHPVAVLEHRPGGEVGLVHGQPVDQHVELAAAQRRVRVEVRDHVQHGPAAGVAGLEGSVSRVSTVMFEVGENPILTTPAACLAAARASSRAAVSCA